MDCRLLKTENFSVDESPLTGESHPVKKRADEAYKDRQVPLAERKNMVYGGCYVTAGNATALVVAVGDNTEIGQIAQIAQRSKNSASRRFNTSSISSANL